MIALAATCAVASVNDRSPGHHASAEEIRTEIEGLKVISVTHVAFFWCVTNFRNSRCVDTQGETRINDKHLGNPSCVSKPRRSCNNVQKLGLTPIERWPHCLAVGAVGSTVEAVREQILRAGIAFQEDLSWCKLYRAGVGWCSFLVNKVQLNKLSKVLLKCRRMLAFMQPFPRFWYVFFGFSSRFSTSKPGQKSWDNWNNSLQNRRSGELLEMVMNLLIQYDLVWCERLWKSRYLSWLRSNSFARC